MCNAKGVFLPPHSSAHCFGVMACSFTVLVLAAVLREIICLPVNRQRSRHAGEESGGFICFSQESGKSQTELRDKIVDIHSSFIKQLSSNIVPPQLLDVYKVSTISSQVCYIHLWKKYSSCDRRLFPPPSVFF